MAAKRREKEDRKIFATNHKARRDYSIEDVREVGIVLQGTEIKSLRQHRVTIDDSFARIEGGEVFLYNMHVSPYVQGGRWNAEPTRPRKLLLHRREIDRLAGLMSQQRVTLVPLRVYESHGKAKVELAVGRGKRVFEKRDRIRKRDSDREIRRTLRNRQR